MSTFSFNQIGVIRSPYKEKFAVPRQPGLIEDGGGELQLLAPYNQPEAVRGLSDFSHLWVIFIFHQTMEGGWRPTVRPPPGRQYPDGRLCYPLHISPKSNRDVSD